MNARDKVVEMVEDGLLDWEMVARECLMRMSTHDVQDMIDECEWDSPDMYEV